MGVADGPQRLPRILCLHGGGTSAEIFRIQTCKLQRALQQHFQFVFIDAPHASTPGPGVLPVFEGFDPYFRWVTWWKNENDYTREERELEEKAVIETLDSVLAQQDNDEAPFVGVMGFSQGARVAAGLLLREQMAGSENRRLRFAVLLAGSYPPIYLPFQPALCDQLIHIPTVHMHGSDDSHLTHSGTLLTRSCDPSAALLMEFKGGHHLPVLTHDTNRLADMIIQVSQQRNLESQ
ncbi:hypothetical protein MMC16_006269 [Acarospora aff. strigata]|nr:hypothetical protein [Acarospora aff. strigata]